MLLFSFGVVVSEELTVNMGENEMRHVRFRCQHRTYHCFINLSSFSFNFFGERFSNPEVF